MFFCTFLFLRIDIACIDIELMTKAALEHDYMDKANFQEALKFLCQKEIGRKTKLLHEWEQLESELAPLMASTIANLINKA